MRRRYPIFLLWLTLTATNARAQAGMEGHGSITMGYRFTDVSGSQGRYDEMFGLRSGLRVNQLNWLGRSEGDDAFANVISLTSTGLGGDPFSETRFRMVRNGVWEAGVSLRRAYSYWDRNDDAVLPSGGNGLTSNHDWATVRHMASADFKLYLTPEVRLTVEYDRTTLDGNRFSTRAIDYFGSSSDWGFFARANPYRVMAPADDTSNRFAGGISWSPSSWSFFFRGGYWHTNEVLDIDSLVDPQRSINIDEAATANELLNAAHWSETRTIGTPFGEFSYNGTVAPGFRLRGGYMYYLHSGPSHVDAVFDGTARADRTGTVFAPYDVTTSVDAEMREPNHIIDQGFTLDLADWMALQTDYRYSRIVVDSDATFASTDANGPVIGTEELRWEQGVSTLDVSLEMVPSNGLLVRPGVRLIKQDVTFMEDNVADSHASRRSRVVSPILSVYYKPDPKLTLRGDVRNTTNDGPYTRVTPRTNFGGRWVIHYNPVERISIENSFRFANAAYTTTQFENKIRLNSTLLYFDITEGYSVYGGFTYDSYLATAEVHFLRGTPPADVTWRDQTISRVWQAGIDVMPVPWAHIQLTGNYVRTTGVGEISGELPISGPLTWPMFMGTAEFRVPRLGTVALDLQRSYYVEEIVQADNFSANILGIRWTVDF